MSSEIITPLKALTKAKDYCALQERSQQELRDKLYQWKLDEETIEFVIAELITEGFISEERFARAYARGKFRIKQWGRVKIKQGLQQHRVSKYCINKAMEEIDEDIYIETLKSIIEHKRASLGKMNKWKLKASLLRYAVGKGYESDLIYGILGGEEEEIIDVFND